MLAQVPPLRPRREDGAGRGRRPRRHSLLPRLEAAAIEGRALERNARALGVAARLRASGRTFPPPSQVANRKRIGSSTDVSEAARVTAPALKQVERLARECPLEVAGAREHAPAPLGEPSERREPAVVEAERSNAFARDRDLFACPHRAASVTARSFVAGHPLENGAVSGDPEAIRRDEPGDDRFAEAPGRFDDELVRAVERVSREEDAGAIRVDQLLDDDGDAGRASVRPSRRRYASAESEWAERQIASTASITVRQPSGR